MKLRELKIKDADRMLSWMKSEETKKIFLKDFSKYSKKDVEAFIKIKNSKNNINMACVDEEDNYLGTISLKNIDYENKNAEYAVSFMKEAQGTGAAKFATEEILRMAFDDLKLEKIYLDVLATNKRAIRFYEKMEFQQEGTFRKHVKKNGKFIDLYWFSIIKDEYSNENKYLDDN